MTLAIYETPFRTQAGHDAYTSLLEDGPLAKLFANPETRFGASKGGSDPRWVRYHDQSHFQHGMAVSTVAGLLFESVLLERGEEPTFEEMRIILAAGALHDFNKIVGGMYPTSLEAHATRFHQLLGDYLPPAADDSVRHLLLATEEGMDGEAGAYSCKIKGNLRVLAKACLAAADSLSTGSLDFPTWLPETYRAQANRIRAKYPILPPIHVIGIHRVPQTALENVVRDALIAWIRETGRILHDSPRAVSWVGKPWDADALSSVVERARESSLAPFEAFLSQIKIHAGSGQFPTDWVNRYEPTPTRVRSILEGKNSQLIFWGGDWGPRHLARLRSFAEVFQHSTKTNGDDTVKLVLPTDPETETGKRLHTQGLIILASCLAHNLTGDVTTSNENSASWNLDSAESKSKKFVAGILDVIEKEPTADLLEEQINLCVVALADQRESRFDDGFEKVALRVLGAPNELSEVGSTGASCVLCGEASTVSIVSQNSHGLKPSAWLPRSAAIQGQQKDTKICQPCALDSAQRARIVQTSNIKGVKDAMYLHIHKSDSAVDGTFLNLMMKVNPKRLPADNGSSGITLYARGTADEPVVRLDNHISIPIPAPSNSDEQFRLLRQLLSLTHDTGHKVHATSLGGIPHVEPCAMSWRNAPSWVQNLAPIDKHGRWPSGFAEIRTDRIPQAQRIVDAISRAAFVNKEGKNAPYIKLATILASRPLALYRYPCNARAGSEEDAPTTILENAFMDKETIEMLDRAGRAYCKFNTREKSAWGTNAHWQWATRSALTGLETRDALQSRAVRGRLHNEARRKNSFAKMEDIDEFVGALEDLLALHAANEQIVRDLIAAVEWTSEKLYHSEFSLKARTTQEISA